MPDGANRRRRIRRTLLFDFFPVRRVEAPCQGSEDSHEDQDPYAQLLALLCGWLGHPLHVANDVGHGSVELQLVHGAWLYLFEADELVHLLAVLVWIFHFLELGGLYALQLPQHVWHGRIWQHHVVEAGWAVVVL